MKTKTMRQIIFGVLLALFILSLGYFVYGSARSGVPLGYLILNSLLLAVPLALLYFCIGLIAEAWQQLNRGEVSRRMARFVYLTPRIAGLLMALFTGLFSLDVFEMEGSLLEKIGAFLIHSAPSIVMLAALALAWRFPWVGALGFGLVAILILLISVIGRQMFAFGNVLIFVLPMAVVAALFWLNWRWRGLIDQVRKPAHG
jgi:hypothetical protein